MTMPAFSVLFDDPVRVQLTWTLFHFLWQGLIIGVLVFAANWLVGSRSPRVRYGIAVVGLAGMMVSVVATWIVVGPEPQLANDASVVEPFPALAEALPQDLLLAPEVDDFLVADLVGELDIAMPDVPPSTTQVVERWASTTTAIYFVGVVLMLLRIALSALGIRHLNTTSQLADSGLQRRGRDLAGRLGLRCQPAIRASARVLVPFVSGVFKPVILLPGFAVTGGSMSVEELDAVLLHELAHVRRGDLLVNLLQRFTEAVLFFHPAVWYVSQTITAERESCCDDIVLQHASRDSYASALIRLAESCLQGERVAPLAALAATGARPTQLRRRLLRILGQKPNRPSMRPGYGIISLCLLALAVAGFQLEAQTEDPAGGDEIVEAVDLELAERNPVEDEELEIDVDVEAKVAGSLARGLLVGEVATVGHESGGVDYKWPLSVEVKDDGSVVATARRREFSRLTGLLHQLASRPNVNIRSMLLKPRGAMTVMTLKGDGLMEALRGVKENYKTDDVNGEDISTSILERVRRNAAEIRKPGDNASFLGPVRIEAVDDDVLIVRGGKQDVERVQRIIGNIEGVAKPALDARRHAVVAELSAVMAKLKAELADLSAQYGAGHPRIKGLQRQLEVVQKTMVDGVKKDSRLHFRSYDFSNSDPKRVLGILQSMFSDSMQTVRFHVDGSRLLVYAPTAVHEAVDALLRHLGSKPESTVEMYRLRFTDAQSAVAVLKRMFGDGAMDEEIRIDADIESNVVVARASAEVHQAIAKLVATLERGDVRDRLPGTQGILGVVIERPQGGARGVVVRSVVPRTLAAAAGLKGGDLLLRYGNQVLTAKNIREVIGGDGDRKAVLEIERDGETMKIEVHPGMLEETGGEVKDGTAGNESESVRVARPGKLSGELVDASSRYVDRSLLTPTAMFYREGHLRFPVSIERAMMHDAIDTSVRKLR